MVQSILDGTKTQTRRTRGLENLSEAKNIKEIKTISDPDKTWLLIRTNEQGTYKMLSRYHIGDVLWVRETFSHAPLTEDSRDYFPNESDFIYKAGSLFIHIKWKPSIFMPKEACRIFLTIKSIRIERLQAIGEEEAKAEGVDKIFNDLFDEWRFKDYANNDFSWRLAVSSFKSLWEKINGKKSWDQNPFVWVYEFERIDKPIDFVI